LVVDATFANIVVVVALVVVELSAVKFWRVVDPVSKRLEREVNPESTERVPVRLVIEPSVCPLIKPEVMVVAKRFVVEATVANKVVVVAFVVVALTPVKFWRVEDARERKPPLRNARPETERTVVEA